MLSGWDLWVNLYMYSLSYRSQSLGAVFVFLYIWINKISKLKKFRAPCFPRSKRDYSHHLFFISLMFRKLLHIAWKQIASNIATLHLWGGLELPPSLWKIYLCLHSNSNGWYVVCIQKRNKRILLGSHFTIILDYKVCVIPDTKVEYAYNLHIFY